MNALLGLSLFVLLAIASQGLPVDQVTPKGYCGFNSFHDQSGCIDRKDEVNASPVLCFDAFPGYMNHSRVCVEGFLCGDPVCNQADGDYDECWSRIVNECRSLGLYKPPTEEPVV